MCYPLLYSGASAAYCRRRSPAGVALQIRVFKCFTPPVMAVGRPSRRCQHHCHCGPWRTCVPVFAGAAPSVDYLGPMSELLDTSRRSRLSEDTARSGDVDLRSETPDGTLSAGSRSKTRQASPRSSKRDTGVQRSGSGTPPRLGGRLAWRKRATFAEVVALATAEKSGSR